MFSFLFFFFLRDCILKKCFFFDFRPTNCLRILFHLPSFLSRRSRQLWELPGMSRFGSKLELPSALQNYGQEALGSLPKDLGLWCSLSQEHGGEWGKEETWWPAVSLVCWWAVLQLTKWKGLKGGRVKAKFTQNERWKNRGKVLEKRKSEDKSIWEKSKQF